MWEQDPPCWPVTVDHMCVDAGPPVDNSRINDRQASLQPLVLWAYLSRTEAPVYAADSSITQTALRSRIPGPAGATEG